MTKIINKSVIKGDNNISVSGINKSKVSIENAENSKSKGGQFWVITGVIVALIALLVQIFVGWDQIIKWL